MRAILCATILLITAISAAIAATRPTIMVRPDCEISGPTCALGDLAQIECADAKTAERLRGIRVCSSPLPGKTRLIAREQLIIALRKAGFADASVDLLCPTQVALRRTQSMIAGQQLFDAAKSFAESAVSFPGRVQIETRRLPADQMTPSGSLELRVRAGTKSLRKGQNNLPVEIVVAGQVYRTINVSLTIRVIAPVLVATKMISRAEAISQANASLEEREITTLPDDALFEAPSADCTAVAPISEGSIIRKQWVAGPLAVKSGDSVLVVVESGGVRVTEKGTAVQDGRPGDRIKIRLAGDVREIRGTVDEPGVVKISLGRRD